MTKAMKEGLNLNSVLIVIVIALGTYTLKKVTEQGEAQAAILARVNQHDVAIGSLNTQVSENRIDITKIRVEAAQNR